MPEGVTAVHSNSEEENGDSGEEAYHSEQEVPSHEEMKSALSDEDNKSRSVSASGSSASDSSDSDGSSEEGNGGNQNDSKSNSGSNSDDSQSGSGSGTGGSDSDSNSGSGSDSSEGKAADSSLNNSGSSSRSKSSSSSGKDDLKKLWEKNPDVYGIRRSGRERKQPERINTEKDTNNKFSRRRSSSQWNSDLSLSEESDDDTYKTRKKFTKTTRRTKRAPSSGSDSDLAISKAPKRSALRGTTSKVSYKEESEGEEATDDENVVDVEWNTQEEPENVQTIEKVMSHRRGKKGAVGMQTYIYEVEKNGDPNSDFDATDPLQCEDHYFIKWKGWAHLHNTWESLESLQTQKVKGLKKLDNFLRKDEELRFMKSRSTPEEVEYIEIQSELERDLFKSHLIAERVFSEVEENETLFYYVKWQNLPYSEATWENEELVTRLFPDQLECYFKREKSSCYPKQCPVLKNRPKFSSMKMQPDFLGGDQEDLELRDYQMDGVNWLIHSWCKNNSVILADEMGLGKTIQTISFLSYLFHVHHLYGPFLIVVPLSTMNAWQREFAQWAPDINVIVYIGDRDSRNIIQEYEWTFKSKRIKFNAVLTTNEILLRDKDVLKDSCQWATLAVDEAHRLKNEESQLYHALMEFRSNHRLLITGTPLQNSLKELWALLHFIMPNKFDDWEYFESQHDVENMKKGFHRLHRQLEPFLLRRVKKDVEKSLPSKVEQILRVDMMQLQKQYYKWILTKNYDMLKKGSRGSTASFVNIVMELKKCCNHAFLTKGNEENCSSNPELLQQLLRGSGKLLLLDKLLVRLNETGHRVLIFSQMVRMLDILAQYLQLRRFPFQRLDGSISGELRRQALDHFNAEGSMDFCFLLSTRAGGLGINLATADTVVIFDSDWNPQNDLQAQARAHRIGQKNQVNIYRLVTKNSIEETIIERAKQKMVLDHLVIQSMDTSGRTVFNKKISSTGSTPFNKEELNAILKFGAEELFKDDEENEEEPMCDIDEILRRAETRDEAPSTAGDELLSAFKVASFNIDEEEEVSKIEQQNEESNKEWDDIIPEKLRATMAEEERQREMAELYLPPRKRKTLNAENEPDTPSPSKRRRRGSETSEYEEESDPEKPRRRGRPRMNQKDVVKGFTDVEVRRFFRSFKRFSNPLRRLDTIAIDADLRDKAVEELRRLGTRILDRCHDAVADYERKSPTEPTAAAPEANGKGAPPRRRRDRGPSFKISGVAINAKTLLSTVEELDPLDKVVPHAPVERASWILPLKKVKDAHWEVPWGIQEDSKLLRGLYEYGMGSWEQIKGDPALNLGDKILLENEVKPQAKHLENRTQYLLKLIKKTQIVMAPKKRGPKPKPKKARELKGAISKEIVENDDTTDDEAVAPAPSSKKQPMKESTKEVEIKDEERETEKAVSVEPEKERSPKPHKKKKEKKEKPSQGPLHITANGEPLPVDASIEFDPSHPQWAECKEKMRPMKKALKALDNPNSDASPEEQVQHTRRCLIQIGDHIDQVLSPHQDHDTHKEWKNLFWQFVSKFTEYDARKLYKLYKKHKKLSEKEGDVGIKEEKEKHHKDRKDKGDSVEKKEDGSHHRHHHKKKKHHKHEDNSAKAEHGDKKGRNGWSAERGRDNGAAEAGVADRGRDKERDESSYSYSRDSEKGYQKPWHRPGQSRDYHESRYPQDLGRDGGYNRDGYKNHGYSRGPNDWGGNRGHSRHHGSYMGSYHHKGGGQYSSQMYGRGGHHSGDSYHGNNQNWGTRKGRPVGGRYEWSVAERGGSHGHGSEWSSKGPRQERSQY